MPRVILTERAQSGYLAFYEYVHVTDTVVIATIMHQREKYFFESAEGN